MKVELTDKEMQAIRRALWEQIMGMDSVEYALFDRFTAILLGDYD